MSTALGTGRPEEKSPSSGLAAIGPATSVGAIFRCPVRIYWEDTDAGGVVFYANYLKFFERARTEWLRTLGIGQQALRVSSGGMFVVSEANVKYHRPARLDDQLLVTARVLEMGRACMTIGQQARLEAQAGGPLLCEATIRIGWVTGTPFKPARIPQTILEAFQ
jgi:acyl-CoA thioester hydrolase